MEQTYFGRRKLGHASTTHESYVIGIIEHLYQANSTGEI